MNQPDSINSLELGFDVPARTGMAESEIQTPCLLLDLDALERNIRRMGDYIRHHGMRHRVHGKMHKSVDIARLQMDLGGAVGVCCQKVSEAEVFVRGGISNVLISNQVRDPLKLARLASLPRLGAEVSVCVDDLDNVAELAAAASAAGTELHCLVEVDCGAGRCGVDSPEQAVAIAKSISESNHLLYAGVQAYQGNIQHLQTYADRQAAFEKSLAITKRMIAALEIAGLAPALVTGGGTGSYHFESNSGVYNELQCGSYAFMDADYGRLADENGKRLDSDEWQNALFLLTSVISHAKADRAVCDAGLKVQSVDSGLPVVAGRNDVTYVCCSDEHGEIEDPEGVLAINQRLRLIPGHCDPTCNLHDWYVGVRNGRVETLWPVSARGKAY